MVDQGETGAGSTIKLTIRQSNGEQFEVDVEASATVLQLKEKCKEKTQLAAESQRLIYKGKHQSFSIRGSLRQVRPKHKSHGCPSCLRTFYWLYLILTFFASL